MKRFIFLLISVICLCCSSLATTSLDRDFYVKTGLQLDAIKRLISTGGDSSSIDSRLYGKVDTITQVSMTSYLQEIPLLVHLNQTYTRASRIRNLVPRSIQILPVFLSLDSLGLLDSSVHLTSGYGAFYDLAGGEAYLDLSDVPSPCKEILAVMGIDSDKEFKIYCATWYLLLKGYNQVPPFYDVSITNLSYYSHFDMIAVYTALCCEKYSTYHLYFPQMGDFGNQ